MPLARSVQVLPDADAVARASAAQFALLAGEAVRLRGVFRVALAGGSTPRKLYALLGGDAGGNVPWSQVHVFWGDERCVPPEHADSNFRMASETLLASGRVPSANVHRIAAELDDERRAASLYEEELRRAFALTAGELPRFDLVLLGMGADGHCASLFPGTTALGETRALAASTLVEKLGASRITLTLPVLRAAANVTFLVAGADKAEMLPRVLAEERGSGEHPASLVRPVRGTLTWLVDRLAAGRLS